MSVRQEARIWNGNRQKIKPAESPPGFIFDDREKRSFYADEEEKMGSPGTELLWLFCRTADRVQRALEEAFPHSEYPICLELGCGKGSVCRRKWE